ncbi:DUF4288 domain-containing protein [Chitinophaga pendula]|uniref:DUF4288 domain-containing protein n=1 Tax=Chitinophaga TaxID=79328 RepID=UPI000BAF75BC|nr:MULTISPECIES: DUF4288 domain-containing protein [Chitinophaga]ASZ14400.1 hypothetical protein CK934_27380 [Chitinophaga sp. MD30]UCJ07947.1 DUF4288 domain-containing protein [Chitinophaga pendula]
MQWFVAKVVYQIISGNGNHLPQFDEQLRLINADNKQAAWKKACEIGLQEQYAFKNQKQELVEWKFINVPELFMLDQLSDGMELYSRIEEPGNAATYLAWLQSKSAQLEDQRYAEISA